MRPRPERNRLTGFDAVMKYMVLVMASLYLVVGVAIIWKSPEFLSIPKRVANPLGIVMICYGLLRAYRGYQRYF